MHFDVISPASGSASRRSTWNIIRDSLPTSLNVPKISDITGIPSHPPSSASPAVPTLSPPPSSPHISPHTAVADGKTIPSPPAHPNPTRTSPPSPAGTSTQLPPEDADTYQEGQEGMPENKEQVGLLDRFKEGVSENSTVITTFVAGGIAGATSRTVVSPLERLKIILQVQTADLSKTTTGQAYNRVWPGLVRMWKEEGFAGFMKGNGINVVRILPYSAIQFTSYGYIKKALTTWSGEETLSTPLRLLSGASAGILAVSVTYPLDLVRARLSIATANMARSATTQFSNEDAHLGILGMTKKVYRTEGGVKGLYRGCWATAVGVAPYVALNFYLYETIRPIILPPGFEPSSEAELVGRKLLSGAMAGGTSLLFTHPFDVVRRKLQVVGIGGSEREYSGAIDCVRKIVKTEGVRKGLYRGLVPNIIKVAPSIAVSFYTFETVKDALTKWTTRKESHTNGQISI